MNLVGTRDIEQIPTCTENMVFFTCNACGSSLKKNQVEKHYQNECRNCEVLSCIDCGQDFYGDEYMSHTKCISEAEKYQGSFYKREESSGKGEKKQQEWLEKVKLSASSANVSPKVARLLDKVLQYPNIPRKKVKFENFVRNSCNVYDGKTLAELWEAFGGTTKQQAPVAPTTPQQESISNQSMELQKKTKAHKVAEDSTCNGAAPFSVETLSKNRAKKRSAEELDTSEQATEVHEVPKDKKRKKKKRSSDLEESCVATNEEGSSITQQCREHSLPKCESEPIEGNEDTTMKLVTEKPKKKKTKRRRDEQDHVECDFEDEPSPVKRAKHQLDTDKEEFKPIKRLDKADNKKHKKKHKHKQ